MIMSVNDLSDSEKSEVLKFVGFCNGCFTFSGKDLFVQMQHIDDLYLLNISENPTINELNSYLEYGYAKILIIKK